MTEDVPRIVATPPGPKTREILARQERVLYPGLAHGLGPFVINRKTGWEIEDVDGNVYLDFISAMASVPFGAARPDVVEPVIEALRRYGSEDTHYYSNEYVLPLAEELLRVAPDGMTRVDIALERHGGGRDGDPVHAARDRPSDRDRVHGRLPRRGRHGGRDRGGDVRSLVRLSRADAGFRPRAVPQRLPDAVHRASRAARATGPSTTSATTSCITRSTRARWRGS